MICYCCHEALAVQLDIVNLFSKQVPLCEKCRREISVWRPGRRCASCHRRMSDEEVECLDCLFLLERYQPPGKTTCLLDYHEMNKMLFHRYKFMGDCALAEIIAMFLPGHYGEYDVITPIPISTQRMTERGYNQTAMVLDAKGIQYEELLGTSRVKRQSELGKNDRSRQENPFFISRPAGIEGRRILVVDDIYTTGITVHQAMEKLHAFRPAAIDVLTFSKA
ncbi:ComF family protein [Salinicoccus sp. ID82-1]|uniref:ComF family protein n=1 Tax=Salinicoccus cyprini TaxID=2493691 RepID=A0A558AR92_9STAP|nr:MULTISPECIES: phosphoribosyltransferase family protein [Salinicoccus]MCG1010176.1 ComF family protein [Salinicoccus sp. ID82-1]TVT26768.1 ComF family protein [Salinicoccus cyprini]